MFHDPELLADAERMLANYDPATALFPRWVLESMVADLRDTETRIASWLKDPS